MRAAPGRVGYRRVVSVFSAIFRELEAAHAAIAVAAADAGRDPSVLRVVLRIVDSAGRSDEVARRLPELEAAGVDEVIVDLDWDGDPVRDYARMAS